MKACFAVGLLLQLGFSLAGAADYFVATEGSDQNPGDEEDPFRTIQFAVNQLRPGDTLHVREGNYPENVTINRSGEDRKVITIRAVEGERVTLDPGSVFANGQSHLRVEGFHFLNTRGERPAIEVTGDGEGVAIVGNEITGLISAGAAALRVGGTMRDFVIRGNHVHHNNTGAQEAIRVHERTRDFQVLDNRVNDNTNIGIDIVGWAQFGKPRNGLVRGNVCRDNATAPGWGTGIYLDGPEDIIVEYNISSGQEYGYQIAVEPSHDSSSGNIVRYNVAHDNKEYGIGIGGYTGGTVHHCQVYNNVFVNNKREIGFSKNAGHDNIVVNNILYNPTGQSINYLSQPVNTVIDHNCYFTRFGDQPGENSVAGDPRFIDLSGRDYRIERGSPCIDAGRLLLERLKDFEGMPVVGLPDIGAFEFQEKGNAVPKNP